LSLVLFNIVADMLVTLISRAKEDVQIIGLVPHLADGHLFILQYADDKILFMEHNLEQVKNMKLLLSAFEKLSGLKIVFHTSEMEQEYTELFGCDIGQYPFRYFGIPMHHKKISNADWKIIEDKFENKTKLLERKIVVLWWQVGSNKLCAK
jgi:hypothetical protein